MGPPAEADQPVMIAASNEEEPQRTPCRLRIWQQRFRLFRIRRRRERADPGEFIQIAQPEVQRLSATHRQPGNRPMVPVPIDGKMFLYVGNEVMQQVFFESRERLYFIRRHDISGRAVVFHRPSVGHDDDHRLNLAQGVKIIQDRLWMAAPEPFLFVAADAMQEIEHRVSLVPRIPRRRIDQRPPRRSNSYRPVAYRIDPSVWDPRLRGIES